MEGSHNTKSLDIGNIQNNTPRSDLERDVASAHREEILNYATKAAILIQKKHIQERLKDSKFQDMILSLVVRESNGTYKWLPDAGRKLLGELDEAVIDRTKQVEDQKLRLSGELEAFMNNFQDIAGDMEQAAKKADLPEYEKSIKSILNSFITKSDALAQDQSFLADATDKIIIASQNATLNKNFLQAIPPDVRKDNRLKGIFDALIPDGVFEEKTRTDLLKNILMEAKKKFTLSVTQGSDLATAKEKTEDKIRIVKNERDEMIAKAFPERAEYLRIIGGASVEGLIWFSMMDDQKIDLARLRINLLEFSHDVSLAKLKQVTGLASETGILTEASRKKLVEYMQNDLKIDNPTEISFKTLPLRSWIPETISKEMISANYNISVFHLLRLGEIADLQKEGNMTNEVAGKLLDLTLVKDRDGSWTVEKNVFVENFSFIFLKEMTSAGLTEAEKKAKDLFAKLETDGKIMHQGNGDFAAKRDEIVQFLTNPANSYSVEKKAAEYVGKMQGAHIYEKSSWGRVKQLGDRFRKDAKIGAKEWFDYVKTIPRNVHFPELDAELLKKIQEKDALETYLDGLTKIETNTKNTGDISEKVVKRLEAFETQRQEKIKKAALAIGIPERVAQAEELLLVTDLVIDRLEKSHNFSHLDARTQKVALWLAVNVDLNEARLFLNDPKKHETDHPDLKPKIDAYLKRERLTEESSGRDVLSEMHHRLGISVFGGALTVLAHSSHPLEGSPLAISTAQPGNWFNHPEQASPGLRAILVGPKNQIDALILAFTMERTTGGVTPTEARRYVLAVKKHVDQQSVDFEAARTQREQKDRFMNPLDVLGSGSKELVKMLRSPDGVQKALAITLIVGAGYLLYKGWQQGGIAKKLVLGIPMFFGMDIVLNRMTGKGILQRLGLQYMDKKERSAVLEQFARRNEKIDRYKFLQEDAGYKALEQLTMSKQTIPVNDLILWRAKVHSAGEGADYKATAPASLEGAAFAVVGELGSLQKKGVSHDGQMQKAYEYLYWTFDALCTDVAEAKKLSGIKNDAGAEYIQKTYVDFRQEYMTADIRKGMRDAAALKGGFTLLDVLVFERKTPSMAAELDQNPYLAEWIQKGTEVAMETGSNYGAAAVVKAQIYGAEGVRLAPEAINYTKEVALDSWDSFYEWAQVTYPKVKMEVGTAAEASLRIIYDTCKSAGIVLVQNGPELIVKVAEGGMSLSLAAAQSLYLEIDRHQVTGNLLVGLESFLRRQFGSSVADLIQLHQRVSDSSEHLRKLSERVLWKKNLSKQINSVVAQQLTISENPSTFDLADRWAIALYEKSFKPLVLGPVPVTDEEKAKIFYEKVSPSERMATFELVKRRLYSKIIARLQKEREDSQKLGRPITYPLKIELWPPDDLTRVPPGGLEKDIADSYGLHTLILLQREMTLPGSIQQSILNVKNNTARTIMEILYTPVAFVTRKDSKDYLFNNVIITLRKYHEKAQDVLKNDPAKERKLALYDHYLETIITNLCIEMTLGRVEGKLEDRATSAFTEKEIPFELTIQQARDFLQYLEDLRGASPDPQKLQEAKVDFHTLKAFESSKNLTPALKAAYLAAAPGLTATPASKTAEPITPDERRDVETVLAHTSPVMSATDQMILLGVLGKDGVEAALQNRIHQKYNNTVDRFIVDNSAKTSEGPVRQQFYNYLKGVTGIAARNKLEEKLLPYFTDIKKMDDLGELAKLREGETRPVLQNTLQHALDLATIQMLKPIVQEIKTVDKDKVKVDERYKTWEQQLLTLYSFTNLSPDRTSDLVSRVLEYLWYPDRDEGYEKYAEKLAEAGKHIRPLQPTPKDVSSYRYRGRFTGPLTYFPIDRASAYARLKSSDVGSKDEHLQIVLDDIGYLKETLKNEL